MDADTKTISILTQRLAQLKKQRSSWVDTWTDLRDNLLPYHGRPLGSGGASTYNDGQRHDTSIYDGLPLRAMGIAGAGLMSGLTSPSRPWLH